MVLGPSKAFRPIAPNGNSTDGRQTFFQPSGLQTFIQCLETWLGLAMIDLPTIEGTASSRLPWGLLLLAWLGDDRFADHRGNCIESPPVGIAAGLAWR
jgi:hypothetical protein